MDNRKAIDILESVFRAGLKRIDPLMMMKNQLTLKGDELIIDTGTESHSIDLGKVDRVLVTGMGKASARMALGLQEVLGDRIDSGLLQ
jgi:hydroxypyruvate reductase